MIFKTAPKNKYKGPVRPPQGKRAKSVTEISAGGIVFKRTPRGVRLGLIRDPYDKWAFPKGHKEEGEKLRGTALRETREEMGLGRLKIVKSLGKIDFWFKDSYRPESKGTLIHKYVHYYLMEAPSKAKGQPQKKERISGIIWVTPERAKKISGYKDVKGVLGQALKWIKNSEKQSPKINNL